MAISSVRPRAVLLLGWMLTGFTAVLGVDDAHAFLPPRVELSPEARSELARQIDRAQERGAGGARRALPPGIPRVHALVLPVEFADTTWRRAVHPVGYVDTLLFGARRSVRDYYRETFNDALDLTGDVLPLRTLGVPIARYTGDGQCAGCARGLGDHPFNAQGLVEDLVTGLDGAIDARDYDADGNGAIDALIVVHAGVGFEDGGRARQFQSHQWHTFSRPAIDGVRADAYILLSEWSGIGGFAHEFLHLFGVPDLYDLNGGGSGLGDWSLMATGASLGSPRYSNPAYPDPWTRIATGYATADAAPFPGVAGSVLLRPVESGGGILALWTDGNPETEYFLVEQRSRSAGTYDRAIPGEGVLVYHVDETEPSQRNQGHYKVALEQADGRFDLESFPPLTFGDDGDPFPGRTGASVFDSASVPDSRAYSGSSSGVSLSGFERSGDGWNLLVRIADDPGIRIDAFQPTEAEGDGDPRIEAGERWNLALGFTNLGDDAGPGWLAARAGGITFQPDSVALAGLAHAASGSAAFTATLPPSLDADPRAFEIVFTFRTSSNVEALSQWLVAGDRFGVNADFESALEPWSHGAGTGGFRDAWHLSTERAGAGLSSMKCGAAAGPGIAYPESLDAALVSPPLLLGAGSELRFLHWIDAETDASGDAFDGGRVEFSLDRVRWAVGEPREGYTHDPVANAAFRLFDGRVWSGASGGWREEVVDLSACDGRAAWIRFRFASDGFDDDPHEGWYVDDVRVVTDDAPIAYFLGEPDVSATAIALRASVVANREAVDATFALLRTPLADPGASPVVLWEELVRDSRSLTITDAPLSVGEARRYRLVERSAPDIVRGERVVAGPSVDPIPHVRFAGPSPLRSGVDVFRVALSPSEQTEWEMGVFSAAGREVARSRATRDGEGFLLSWDVHAFGRPAPPGVYFYAVEGLGSAARGRIVVTP